MYSQQCGYALTDVQAVHDKMRTLFKVLPGGGLDPTAGKARYVIQGNGVLVRNCLETYANVMES